MLLIILDLWSLLVRLRSGAFLLPNPSMGGCGWQPFCQWVGGSQVRHGVHIWRGGWRHVAHGPGQEGGVTYLPVWKERASQVTHGPPIPSQTVNRITNTNEIVPSLILGQLPVIIGYYSGSVLWIIIDTT